MKWNLVLIIFLIVLIQNCTISQEARTTFVPMEDDITLATDIWIPDEGEGPWPVILIRTPYSRARESRYGKFFSRNGYVVALQDVRGQFDSEGDLELWINEKKDGYYAIEWLADKNWCNGKVGMIGGSYGGYTQVAAAVEKPPHLVTIIPKVSMADPSIHHVYPGGVYSMQEQMQAAHVFAHNYRKSNKHPALPNDWKNQLFTLPVIDLDKQLTNQELSQWRNHVHHKPDDPYWEKADFLSELRSINIPVFIIGGWFDFAGMGTKESYLHLKESSNRNIKLLIGPWTHQGLGKSKIGPYDFGEKAQMDIDHETLRWFDYWLKGEANGIMDEALVQVFATGPNEWIESNTYPPAESKVQKLYLTHSGLSYESNVQAKIINSFTYDPEDPTPSVWYDNAQLHDSIFRSRKDMLIFETEALENAKMILGPVTANIYASSTAPDTDWFVYLMEVDTAGHTGSLVLRGQVRARYRDIEMGPQLLETEKIYEYKFDLLHTSYQIPAGNRLRVLICSAAFPRFSRNLNTGKDNENTIEYRIAEQNIYHSLEYPSSISLHVIDLE